MLIISIISPINTQGLNSLHDSLQLHNQIIWIPP